MTSSNNTDQILPHTSFNPTASATILLIHGAFATGMEEWHKVIPHLDSYHVLIPTLPSHRGSSIKTSASYPSTLVDTSAHQLAALIRAGAVNGKAHVVGFSWGAHVAIRLISGYPDVVDAALVTGYNVLPAFYRVGLTYAMFLSMRLSAAISIMLPRSPPEPSDIEYENGEPLVSTGYPLNVYREVVNTLCHSHWPEPWTARTLIIAARKTGALYVADHLEDAVRLRKIGTAGNPDTLACTHHGLRHAWHRELPDFFAETLRAWLESRILLEGFERV